jgi:hypothetical protein
MGCITNGIMKWVLHNTLFEDAVKLNIANCPLKVSASFRPNDSSPLNATKNTHHVAEYVKWS